MPQHVKIHFQLTQNEDDYPPVSVESVWATPLDASDEFVLDNVPFFVPNATLGDTVKASAREGGYWFDRVVRRSENSLIRVVFLDETHREQVMRDLQGLDCSIEYLKAHSLLAVNIPAHASLTAVQRYLQREAAADILDYEEPILRQ